MPASIGKTVPGSSAMWIVDIPTSCRVPLGTEIEVLKTNNPIEKITYYSRYRGRVVADYEWHFLLDTGYYLVSINKHDIACRTVIIKGHDIGIPRRPI